MKEWSALDCILEEFILNFENDPTAPIQVTASV